MKIVFQHPIPIPVQKYGGTERILFWHLKELMRLGHEVVFIGHPKCKLDTIVTKFIPCDDQDNWLHLIPKDADILHLQYNYSPKLDIPVINTLHGNGKAGESFSKNTVFVGKKHAQNHGASAYVHNALDLNEYPFDNSKEIITSFDHLLFLAKANWSVKNLKDCVKACKKVKKDLHIAGGKTFSFSSLIHNHGFVDDVQKMNLFSLCDALLFPIRWEEPFGIAIIEAMSQGIPVIGSNHGSLPEIITAQTGVITNNYTDFCHALNKDDYSFDPQIIRKYVENNFSIEQYSAAFVSFYQRVMNCEELNQNTPSWNLKKSPGELLSFQK